jgi:hypothetical protein
VLVSATVENGRLCAVTLRPQSPVQIQLAYRDRVSTLELDLNAGQVLTLDEGQIAQLQTAPTLSAF